MPAWWQYYDHAAAVVTEAAEKVDQQSAPLKNYEAKMNTARTEIRAEQDAVAPLLTAVDDRSYWVRIIDDIHERLPKEFIWVTSFARRFRGFKSSLRRTGQAWPEKSPGLAGAVSRLAARSSC